MFNHEPDGYECPFCAIVAGGSDKHTSQDDIVFKNEHATAFVAPKWWINNPGNVVVIPNEHFENLYTISDDQLAAVMKIVKLVAIAIRSTYDCEGTSIREHNEPAGNQALWHLHVHVFPRYTNDKLYHNHDKKQFVDPEVRAPYIK